MLVGDAPSAWASGGVRMLHCSSNDDSHHGPPARPPLLLEATNEYHLDRESLRGCEMVNLAYAH